MDLLHDALDCGGFTLADGPKVSQQGCDIVVPSGENLADSLRHQARIPKLIVYLPQLSFGSLQLPAGFGDGIVGSPPHLLCLFIAGADFGQESCQATCLRVSSSLEYSDLVSQPLEDLDCQTCPKIRIGKAPCIKTDLRDVDCEWTSDLPRLSPGRSNALHLLLHHRHECRLAAPPVTEKPNCERWGVALEACEFGETSRVNAAT
jgi:hypothetical protein